MCVSVLERDENLKLHWQSKWTMRVFPSVKQSLQICQDHRGDFLTCDEEKMSQTMTTERPQMVMSLSHFSFEACFSPDSATVSSWYNNSANFHKVYNQHLYRGDTKSSNCEYSEDCYAVVLAEAGLWWCKSRVGVKGRQTHLSEDKLRKHGNKTGVWQTDTRAGHTAGPESRVCSPAAHNERTNRLKRL